MAIDITIEKNGISKMVPVGFSWTTLFFGFFVPLFRGDFIWFIIMLILTAMSLGIINFILCFFYNRIYVSKFINDGWRPADDYSANILKSKGIISNY